MAVKGFPYPAPPSLTEDDFAKVRAAVLERDGGSERSPLSPFVPGASGAARGAAGTSPGVIPAVASSPSTTSQQQQQQQKQKQRPQSRWGSSSGGGSPGARSADGKSGVGIDQRLFAPVLRAILAGEGDHVLRRSLLCHPFLKSSSSTKSGNTSASAAGGGGSSWGGGSSSLGAKPGVASSPLSGGRRKDKDSKGSKGGKAKKRDRVDRAAGRNQDDLAGQGQGQGQGHGSSPSSSKGGAGTGGERPSPLDVSREMGRLAEGAAADGSLQSTLILVKTLLCAVDPGTKASVLGAGGSPRKQSQRQGRSQVAGADDDDSSARSTGLTLSTAPLRALAGPGLSGWSDVMELLRKVKYRERMVALRGRPSLTVCSGKADMKGRLEAKGECAGVVTAVQVRQDRTKRPSAARNCGGVAGELYESSRVESSLFTWRRVHQHDPQLKHGMSYSYLLRLSRSQTIVLRLLC